MKTRILSVLMVILMTFCSISCNLDFNGSLSGGNQGGNSSGDLIVSDSNKLQILKSDFKLSEEDMVDRIKAEYLIENDGFKDDDEIIVTIALKGESLMDSYLNDYAYAYKSVADFACSPVGKNTVKNLQNAQRLFINELNARNLIGEVTASYTTIINGISVKIKYGDMQAIENIAKVSAVIMNETYNLPKTTTGSTNTSAIENAVDIYETGIFKPVGVSYDGNNTSVAVLDSGFDCSHSVFATQPEQPMFREDEIARILPQTNAAKITKSLELDDVHYSDKIPFAYDYADKDADVFPFDSEHGTHVAGIIGGQDDTITGIAKNTQLILMKVFPDLDSGAKTDDILTALEDAVLLGVDAINLSLGSACGFTREEDGNKINEVYDKINEAGISLVAAASNDYSSAYGGPEGNTNKVTNPDSATVGSPSTYTTSLSVASISGKKSRYLVANDEQVIFFNESNSINGKANDFFKEIGIEAGGSQTYEYITIPGNGLKVNYTSLGSKVKGKIALVRRGGNTFEEKAALAKAAGAIACIIYNNVEGDILMSMGKSDHIPTISISKEDGTILASKSSGTILLADANQAGPFMSDFSSWGPTSDLKIKPEITAHGGDIYSAVPGGGYDYQSGTSMASPNMCGAIVLLRQHLKEQYPDASHKEISILANQLLMSTATIVLNQQGNPYSPRKQGAGLASLRGAVTTPAYLTVDGIDRTKLELGDDAERTGVYEMEFNLVNLSTKAVEYDLSVLALTESVSTSDDDFVAEKSYMLNGSNKYEVLGENGSISGNRLTVNAGQTAKVKVTYTMSDEDKDYITNAFPYGMFVEGFVTLTADNGGVNLNVPFLSFFGDWTEAPMFDKTYYEVESEAHNGAIDEEDKLKADYYATTPYGSYYYNYIIPLGTYLYDLDTNAYDAIPASEDHIATSNFLGAIDGISCVYAGLLRNAKEMHYTIVDKATGEVVWSYTDHNASKAHYYGGIQFPYYDNLKISSYKLGFVNNREYTFLMSATLDYGNGGVESNARNTFSFDFTMDNEAPVIKEVTYDKEYDKTLKKDRYYINVTVYDNHYAMSIAPILFTSSSSYTFLTENPIPIYSEKGSDTVVRFEVTDFLEDIEFDELIQSGLAFSVDDYALNANLYICQLPGTKGDFTFTKDGQVGSSELNILTFKEGEVIDMTEYLATKDGTVDADKDYLKHLYWESSKPDVVSVKEGVIKCLKKGSATITVTEQMDLKSASIIIKVSSASSTSTEGAILPDYEDATINKIRFSHYETLFAYSRAAQYSDIGETGDTKFLSASNGISFYPGEKVKLFYDLDPWYAADNYELTFTSTRPEIVSVNENGEITALKKGNAIIQLTVAGSNLMATVNVTVKSEFVIENRQLIAYKGLGGVVEIPDDEGILYIGAYAFCLYETDQTMELPEDDYDANKIPSMNTTVTKVIIPEGVEDIQKYAFYNCVGLKEVVIPSSIKYIREYAFYNTALKTVNVQKAKVIGHHCFASCLSLESIEMPEIYAIGARAFEDCENLKEVDLTTLRNTGSEAFKDCTSLTSVVLGEHTKLSYAMFVNSGITQIDIYEREEIPTFCFAQCKNLNRVTLHHDLKTIGYGAFSECTSLTTVNLGKVSVIQEQAFYGDSELAEIALPNCEFTLGNYAFLDCSKLEKVSFGANTKINQVLGNIFQGTAVKTFEVDSENAYYIAEQNGTLLVNKDGKDTVIFASFALNGEYELDEKYTKIANSAFAGTNITKLTITNANTKIGEYAFMGAKNLAVVVLPQTSGLEIGAYAFSELEALTTIENLDKVLVVGDYAFAMSAMTNAVVGANAVYGEGVFFESKLVTATIGANAKLGLGVFQRCRDLTTVNMPEEGGVHIGSFCFAYSTQLATIDLSKTDDYIEEGAFIGCTSIKKAELTNVKTVGDYAFADCAALNLVTVPVVEEIGEGAFSQYSESGSAPMMSSISLPSTLKTIGDGAFLGCASLLSIVIPEQVTEIADYTFAYCTALERVVLGERVTTIGVYAFARCGALAKVNLENVEVFKEYAFAKIEDPYSAVLEDANLSSARCIGEGAFTNSGINGNIVANELTEIGAYAFQNTYLESFDAPSLEVLGEGAFCYNIYLETFTFATTLEYIAPMVFVGCTYLDTYNYSNGNELLTEGNINDYAKLEGGALYTIAHNGKWILNSIPAALDLETFEVAKNTVRIELYAGNENKNIKKLILPDGLKLIGNYAFYGYDKLKTVEFRSVTAPALESEYDSNLVLSETAPGYVKLHAFFDLFGWDLYYCNFIDLVGNKAPITMILPANSDIEGYDSLAYEVYFGSVESSLRSEYIAMEKEMVEFIEYAKEIQNIQFVTLTHEALINDALTAYNALTQNATDYGISEEEWNSMVESVKSARKTLTHIKLAKAIQAVRDVQAVVDALDKNFDIANIDNLKAVMAQINSLSIENRLILDLTEYNELVAKYNAYLEGVEIEASSITNTVSQLTYKKVAATAAVASMLSALTVVLAVVIKRKLA